jgi:transposase
MKKQKESVKNNLLQQSNFINIQDKGQIKYEMLRAHCHDGYFISKVCKEFGYSRESFYKALDSFQKDGLSGLVGKTRGKIKPDKLTPEIIGFIIYQRAKFGLSGAAITQSILKEFNLKLHKRTVERVLGYYGVFDL